MANKFIVEDDSPEFHEGVNHWKNEWKGMPEYSNQHTPPFKSVMVHFRNKEDYEAFQALIAQPLTDKTKSLWHPKLEGRTNPFLRYVDEEDAQ